MLKEVCRMLLGIIIIVFIVIGILMGLDFEPTPTNNKPPSQVQEYTPKDKAAIERDERELAEAERLNRAINNSNHELEDNMAQLEKHMGHKK